MNNCYYHQNEEAVGQCQICGKYLCRDCFNLTQGHICYDCAQEINNKNKKNLLINAIITLIIVAAWVVALIMMDNPDLKTYTNIIVLVVGVVPAWRMLSIVTNKMFANTTFVGGAIAAYFIVKAVLSIVCSLVMLPYYVIKLIVGFVKYIKESKNYKLVEQNHLSLMNK